MDTIGIIGAMEEEVAMLIECMEPSLRRNIVGLDFYIGKINDKSVVVVKCGIGKVNAAICTQVMIDHFAVDKIINIGVAGAIYKELKVGDIVISSDGVQHDMDTTVFGDPLGVIPRMEESFFKADNDLIEIAKKADSSCEGTHNVYIGRVVSGDQFISCAEKKKQLWSEFQAYCTEMEGAAIAHACYLNNIPFVIIRAISDSADGSADMDFAEFTKLAAKNSSHLVKSMLELL